MSSYLCHPEFWDVTVRDILEMSGTHACECLIDPELFERKERKVKGGGTEWWKEYLPSLWCTECRHVVHSTQTRIRYWNMDETRRFCSLIRFLDTEPDFDGTDVKKEFTVLEDIALKVIHKRQMRLRGRGLAS